MASARLLEAIAVAAELTGTDHSPAAARVFAEDLSLYPEEQVLGALNRCRKELRGRMTPADVISRLADGRPGPEEAWAALPKNEHVSAFWTDEMCIAAGVAQPLIDEGDLIAARKAFTERYSVLLLEARDRGTPVRWIPSLGTDRLAREAAILDAVQKNRISAAYAATLMPHDRAIELLPPTVQQLVERTSAALKLVDKGKKAA